MRVRIVANPKAGRGNAGRVMQQAAVRFRGAGIDVETTEPSSRDETRALAVLAAQEGIDAVIACGGDGTTHDVLQGLVGTPTALGVLPTGSGDDVAGSLGLATGGIDCAVSTLLRDLQQGLARAVDVGVALTATGTSHYFASVLCTGFDARVNSRANSMRRWLGHRYTLAMIRELASFNAMQYTIDANGELATTTAMIVSVGNGPRYGGGMHICPEADPHDGLLDITILHKVSRARLLWSFRLVFSGAHTALPFVETRRVPSVTLESYGATAFADGERLGALPVTITTRPAALRVIGSMRPTNITP